MNCGPYQVTENVSNYSPLISREGIQFMNISHLNVTDIFGAVQTKFVHLNVQCKNPTECGHSSSSPHAN
jgi:hypothetical protein